MILGEEPSVVRVYVVCAHYVNLFWRINSMNGFFRRYGASCKTK